jgi:hypothetical protein
LSKPTRFTARRAVLVTGGAFTLAAPLLVGIYTREVGLATVAAVCGAFVTLLAKIDDLVELSLGPVKARMRETIQQAAATVEQLQKIAVVSTRAQLTALMSASFMHGANMEQRLAIRGQLIDELEALGISKGDIASVETEWRKGVGIIYHRYVREYLAGMKEHPEVRYPEEARKAAYSEIDGLMHFPTWSAATPEQIKAVLDRHGIAPTSGLAEWLADYRHFLNTGEIRNTDKFAAR